jgi:hypothetical protein
MLKRQSIRLDVVGRNAGRRFRGRGLSSGSGGASLRLRLHGQIGAAGLLGLHGSRLARRTPGRSARLAPRGCDDG